MYRALAITVAAGLAMLAGVCLAQVEVHKDGTFSVDLGRMSSGQMVVGNGYLSIESDGSVSHDGKALINKDGKMLVPMKDFDRILQESFYVATRNGNANISNVGGNVSVVYK